MQLIPSMDLLGGRIVRLRHGDRRWITYYDWTAEAWVERLVEAGARRIHLVDLDGAFGEAQQPVFRAFPQRWPKVRFQTGGGLRSREAVQGPDPSCAVEGDGSLNCAGYGSVVSVTATFGQCAAGWVLDQLSSRAA